MRCEDGQVRVEAVNFTSGCARLFWFEILLGEARQSRIKQDARGLGVVPRFPTYGRRIPFLLCLYPRVAPER